MFSRPDGRAANALRPVEIVRHYTKHAPGSVLVAFGDTHVLVTASIEERVPRHILTNGIDNHGWLTAEYAMLPGATQTRTNRERMRVSGRSNEIQRLIGRSLRACIALEKLGQRTVTIDADVIQADGGTRVAAITGAYVALVDAVRHLQNRELLKENPLQCAVAAVSVGVIEDTPILDLNYEEDSQAEVDANIVMTDRGEFIEVQATSERAPLRRDGLNTMLDLAHGGLESLFAIQKNALGDDVPVEPVSAPGV